VAGHVVGLGRDLLRELRAEVLVRVLELDLTGDGHAVVGDRGGAPLLVQDDVAALGAERHLDGVRELVDAALERAACVLCVQDLLGHTTQSAQSLMTARMSREPRTRNSSLPYFSSVPPYLENTTLSPTSTSMETRSPLSSKRPAPPAMTSHSECFAFAASAMTRPDAVVCPASRALSTTRAPWVLI